MSRLFSLFRYGWQPRDQGPSLDDFAAMGRKALSELPDPFLQLSSDIVINAADYPEPDVLEEMGIASPYDLLGLFTGIGLAQDGGQIFTGRPANQIWLYRKPILAFWAERDESLERIVAHVLIHEIGHHFGLSDADMERIEQEAG